MKKHSIPKTIVILMFVIFCISESLVWSAEPDHFRQYAYPSDGFEAAFPQKPLKFRTELPDGGYSNSYQAIVSNPLSQYSVFVAHMPKRVFKDTAIEAYLDGIVSGLASGFDQAVLTYTKRISFLSFPAIEYQFTCKDEEVPVVVRGIVLMVDGEHTRLSQISIPSDPNADKDFRRFVDSFRLLPINVALSKHRIDDRVRGISFSPPEGWEQDKPKFPQMVGFFWNPGGHSITVLDSGTPVYSCESYAKELQMTQGLQKQGTFTSGRRTMNWMKSTVYNTDNGIRMASIHYCVNTTRGAVVIIGMAPEQTFFRSETIFRKVAKSLSARK